MKLRRPSVVLAAADVVGLLLVLAAVGGEARVLSINRHVGSGSGGRSGFGDLLLPAKNAAELEGMMGGLGNGSQVQSMGNLVSKILASGQASSDPAAVATLSSQLDALVKFLTGEVGKAHEASKKEANIAVKAFDRCPGYKPDHILGPADTPQVLFLRDRVRGLRRRIKYCKTAKAQLKKQRKSCKKRFGAWEERRKALCSGWEAFDRLSHTEHPKTCEVSPAGETELQWALRLQKWIQQQLDEGAKLKRRCNSAGRHRDCKKIDEQLHNATLHCNIDLKTKFKEAQCMWFNAVKGQCKSYRSCYSQQAEVYRNVTEQISQEVLQRKLQAQMLRRLSCLIGAMDAKTGEVNKVLLDHCAAVLLHDVSHLDIKFSTPPPQVTCKTKFASRATTRRCQGILKKKKKRKSNRPFARDGKYYWSKCVANPSKVNVCKGGYTQKGDRVTDQDWRHNRRKCMITQKHEMLNGLIVTKKKHRAMKVVCEWSYRPDEYVSGRCTKVKFVEKQCVDGTRFVSMTPCHGAVQARRGMWQAVCSAPR